MYAGNFKTRFEGFLKLLVRYQTEPDAIVWRDSLDTPGVTVKEAVDSANKVSTYLRKKKGLDAEDVVMLHLKRGTKIYVACTGIWMGGIALVVCEEDTPEEQYQYILKDCNCKFVIDENNWDEIMATETDGFCFGNPDPHNLAYITYTSGSMTGDPKGVMHEFGNMNRSIEVQQYDGKPILDKDDVFALNSPMSFVASFDFSFALLGSACIFIIPREIVNSDPETIADYYEKAGITSTFMLPHVCRSFKKFNPQMRTILVGGELCFNLYRDDVTIFNCYGMAESGHSLCIFKIDKPYEITPCGKPTPGTQLSVIDAKGEKVRRGEHGKIIFEAPFVRGYLNRPELNEVAFRNGYYHSIDIGSIDNSNMLTMYSRDPFCVTVKGKEVETAVISGTVQRAFDVEWAYVKAFKDKKADNYLVLYYYDKEKTIDIEEGWVHMLSVMPRYTVPSRIVRLDKIPTLPTGKIDVRALEEPKDTFVRKNMVPPTNPLERRIVKAFEEVLDIQQIGIEDNFFHLGGDSMSAMQVAAKVGHPNIFVYTIHRGRTAKEIARLADTMPEADWETLELEARQKEQPLLPIQVEIFKLIQKAPFSTGYNTPSFWKFKASQVNPDRLLECVRRLINAHPAFKTIIKRKENGEVVQYFDPNIMPLMMVEPIDERDLPDIKKRLVIPFQLFNAPLFRFRIFATEEHTYLFFDFLRIIGDNFSLRYLSQDLARAYKGEAMSNDYLYYYLDRKAKEVGTPEYEKHMNFYRKHYTDPSYYYTPDFDKQSDRHRLDTLDIKMDFTREQLDEFLKHNQITLNIFAMAASLLAGYFIRPNAAKFMHSWLWNGRDTAYKENAVGPYYKNLPVSIDFDLIDNLTMLFNDVRKQTILGIEHSAVQYFTDEFRRAFRVANMGDLRVSYKVEGFDFEDEPLPGNDDRLAILPMELRFYEEGELVVQLRYDRDVYTTETADATAENFRRTCRAIIEAPSTDSATFKSLRARVIEIQREEENQ